MTDRTGKPTTARGSGGRQLELEHLASQWNNQQTALSIASGHAFRKNVLERGEFPFIKTKDEFAAEISRIMNNPSETKILDRGRVAYWDESTGTIVIFDPYHDDKGTAFKPTSRKGYFDRL